MTATEFVNKVLTQRSEFIKHLKDDVAKNDKIIDSVTEQLNDLKMTTANVKELGKKVEHPSLIPLGKNIYVNGTIVHTGEFFLDKLAFPDSYSVVETLDGTIKQLERRIEKQSELLQRSENAKEQLVERIRLFEGNETLEDQDAPKEIKSDKGTAIKVGEFYEILEYEN